MTEEKTKSQSLSDAAQELIDLQAANEAVVELMNKFLEEKPAADPATLRDFQRHQNQLVLQLILHQQKQIISLRNALTTVLVNSIQNRQISNALVLALKQHGIDPTETLKEMNQERAKPDGEAQV